MDVENAWLEARRASAATTVANASRRGRKVTLISGPLLWDNCRDYTLDWEERQKSLSRQDNKFVFTRECGIIVL